MVGSKFGSGKRACDGINTDRNEPDRERKSQASVLDKIHIGSSVVSSETFPATSIYVFVVVSVRLENQNIFSRFLAAIILVDREQNWAFHLSLGHENLHLILQRVRTIHAEGPTSLVETLVVT